MIFFYIAIIFVRPYMKYRTGPRSQFAVCLLSVVCCLSVVLGNFKSSDWSTWFMQVILTNQIQAVNATSTWLCWPGVVEHRRPKKAI